MGVALSTADWSSKHAIAKSFVTFDTSFLNLA